MPGGYVFDLKAFFFVAVVFFVSGPPLLISRLITSIQLLQAGAEKRKFLSYRHYQPDLCNSVDLEKIQM